MNNESNGNGFKFIEVLIIVLITSCFSVFAGINYAKSKYNVVKHVNGIDYDYEMTEKLKEFNKNYLYIINNYYDKSIIKEDELLNKALETVIEELNINDKYSAYMDQDEYGNFNVMLAGKYNGIGIINSKSKKEEYITILGVFENSPAQKAGLKEGDIIISIDNKKTNTAELDYFVKYMKDKKNKKMSFVIKRGSQEIKKSIKSNNVELKSVTSSIITEDKKKIGYIYISIFAQNTSNQFKDAIRSLEKNNIEALIIDVRQNSGGHLSSVTDILSSLVKNGKVLYQLETDGSKTKVYSTGTNDYAKPIILLGDNNSASSSEVLIYSLKENLNCKFVGRSTYGKGTVQEMLSLENGNKYKITTKKWLSPKGNWVNDTKGIKPDIDVELNINKNDKYDNQVKKALSLLTEK